MQTAGLKSTAVHLRTDIALARCWADLEVSCEQIDAAYRRGELDLPTAEELSMLTAAAAPGVPEEAGIPAEALVDMEAHCPCCGGADWWRVGTRIACAICHPTPSVQFDSRQAA
jgi:hypothetical protein